MDKQIVTKETKGAIIAAALLSFIGILVETSLNVTFPLLTKEFGVSLGTVQWLTSGYLLLVAVIMSTTGFLNQRFAARSLFTTAIVFNLCGTALCAVVHTFGILLLGRLLQAVSTGISTPLMFNLVLSLIPSSQRGSYMGFSEMVISFAPALGPTYGGTLTSFWSWRGIFIIALLLLIITAFLGEKYIRLQPAATSEKFDWLGVVLLTVVFGSLSLAFTNAGNYGFASWQFASLLIIFVIAAAILGVHLHYSERKIINFAILGNKLIGLRWLNYFILAFINIGISFVLPIFMEDCLHVSSFVAGLALFPGALVGAIIAPFAGKMFDRSGAFTTLLISSLVLILGSVIFFVTTKSITLLAIVLIYILIRFGFNMGFSNSMTDATMHIAPQLNADLNSLFSTFQQYAGSFGTSVLSAVLSANQVQDKLVTSTINGAQLDYGILIVLSVISLGTVLLAAKK